MNINHALTVQSDFSIGKSMLQISQIVDRAAELGYETVAIVDDMSIHGMVDFSNRAKKKGIRPIIGCRLRIYDDAQYRKPSKASGIKEQPNYFFCPKVYVKDERGITGLLKLLSKASSAANFYYNSRADLDDLLALEGVVVTSGDMYGAFSHSRHVEILDKLHAHFGDDFYVELSPIDSPLFDTINAKAVNYANRSKANKLVTYPVNYLDNADADTLDVLSAIASNTQLSVPYRPKQQIKDFAFTEPNRLIDRSKETAYRLHKKLGLPATFIWADGLRAIEEVAAKCTYQFEKQPISLPKLAVNEFMALGQKCIAGWRERFKSEVLGHKPTALELQTVYKDRLAYELSVLKGMGFSSYFLLVEELVTWSKSNGVIVGPGRGSVGGSLVAYLLGITDVDPIRFGLIFERFINPERLDLPDADLDFASSKRHLVVEHLMETYGKDHVAGISNYSTLASASALRDAGRISGLSGFELSATKLVPKEHGLSTTLTDAAKLVPEIEKFKADHAEIWRHAIKLEGVMKNFGQHAAGIVVGGEPLTSRAVVETRGDTPIVNWDKRVVEDWGLVKMDLLGLSTLDVLEIAKQYIEERHGVVIDYLKLSLEDKKVMQAFGRGETTGVFQFESGGMRKLLKSLAEVDELTFEDIAAATALYRPGPMDSGLMDDYIAVKQGLRPVTYEHANMESALNETGGVIVYQEQVMKLAVDLAGFTNAEADVLRKAMGKKDPVMMAEQRDKWTKGCIDTSALPEALAQAIFDKIEMFAGYAFNKSHSTAYSIISVWCAYIRVYYPAEYFAASMSIAKEDKLPSLVRDARECGIEVLPPNINLSSERFTIPDDSSILAPFTAVKGVSETTAKAIVKLRQQNRDWHVVRTKRTGTDVMGYDTTAKIKGRFASIQEFEFAAAMPNSKVNTRVVENLRRVGAFADIDTSELPARHVDRRKDQTELLPGIIIDMVKADRQTDLSEGFLKSRIVMVAQDYKKCDGCDLFGQAHPTPRCSNTVKFMVISDCPTWEEEKKDKLLEGQSALYIKTAIKTAELSVAHGYYTTLVKAKKNDKFLSNAQLNGCRKFIDQEIELIKPSVIVALGSATIKYLLPEHKGGVAELVGKTFYNSKLDATIVCGLNPQQIIFDETKQEGLNEAFRRVSEVLS